MKKIGFYPGSFDPFTNGHLHVIQKSSELFDKVIVAIGINSQKTRHYDKEHMKKAIEQVLINEGLTNVEVICFNGLAVRAALNYHSTYLIRGIRNGIDYNYEENIASVNEEIAGIDTIYIRAGSLGNVSSSMVRELLEFNDDVSKYVPEEILSLILNK